MRSIRQSILLFTLFTVVLIPASTLYAQGSGPGIAILGDVSKPGFRSVDELKQQFGKEIQTIQFTSGPDKLQKSGTGIPLLSLINTAELKTEKTPKHYNFSFMVILESLDGYRAYFSFAELSSQLGRAQVWLLWDVDGKPLTGKEAPLRLVVSTDHSPDRWIYGIAGMTLVDGVKLANQLAVKK
jgi:hypothetical protein